MRDADWIELDRLVEDAMKCWAIPGLAIAVVQGDDTILLKGYGVRELGASAAVTPDTQFMICSLTKSINAAGIALLVDEKRLNWDTRGVKYCRNSSFEIRPRLKLSLSPIC